MSNEPQHTEHSLRPRSEEGRTGYFALQTERFVHLVELGAAAIFAFLFAVGVADLALQIGQAILSGDITHPTAVIGIIDTGLLLLIIVEVYQTVIAYTRGNETREIVRLIVYTGIIAMVRKVIIFRVTNYPSTHAALLAAVAYTVIVIGLGAVLLIEARADR